MRIDPPVVVLKLRPYPLHAGTIGIARSLGRLGAEVHVLGEREGSPVARSRYVRSVAMPPPHLTSPDQLARWIRQVAPPRRPLLVPIDDIGATFVQQQADILLDGYRFHRLPDGLVDRLVDKATLSGLTRAAGVPSPTHAAPSTLEQVDAFLADAAFPVVVKMRDPDLFERTDGVRSVEIAEDAASAREFWTRHLVDGRPNCLLQEYIPGGPETVWMVNAYVDAESEVRFAATGRKLRQYPPYIGATSLGICERNQEVLHLTAQLVQHIGYRGILDVGWRFDARDGRYKLLDFNPRIGATFRLFVDHRGLDVLRACYLDMAAKPIAMDEVSDGRKWINEAYDVFSAARYIADRNLTLRDYVHSLRHVAEATWAAKDDQAPARGMLRTSSRTALSYGVRKVRTSLGRR